MLCSLTPLGGFSLHSLRLLANVYIIKCVHFPADWPAGDKQYLAISEGRSHRK